MNPNNLPFVGIIKNVDKDFFGKVTNLEGKSVLLIGFSEGEVDDYVSKYLPKDITMLTKWRDHDDAKIQKYKLCIGDICQRTVFEDDSFDAVLTLSVLEHLGELENAVTEMVRITKNGGDNIHMFGPVWSCAYGHHIYAQPNDSLLNFSLWNMPAHMHLLCSPEEIVNYYIEQGRKESDGYLALHWFFETPIINRLFYDDYLRIFSNARLQLDSQELMYNIIPAAHLSKLQNVYPGINDFSTYGAKVKFIVNK